MGVSRTRGCRVFLVDDASGIPISGEGHRGPSKAHADDADAKFPSDVENKRKGLWFNK